MRALVEASVHFRIETSHPQIAQRFLDDAYFTGKLTNEMVQEIKTMWNDPGIQKTFARSSEFQLNDSAQ
jgi:hypothetical protein